MEVGSRVLVRSAEDSFYLPPLKESRCEHSPSCLVDDEDNHLLQHGYAAAFMLDKLYQFHKIKGDGDDRGYQRMAGLRKVYGRYDKKQSDVVD